MRFDEDRYCSKHTHPDDGNLNVHRNVSYRSTIYAAQEQKGNTMQQARAAETQEKDVLASDILFSISCL
jgi:hypothetical protein